MDADGPAVSTSVPPPGFQPEHTYGSVSPADAAPVGLPAPAPVVTSQSVARRAGGRRISSRLVAAGGLLIAAVAIIFVLVGSTSSPVTDPIAQAATLSYGTPGYRMSLAMTLNSPTLSAPVSVAGDAIVDLRDQAMSMSFALDMSQMPQVSQALGSTTMRLDMILVHGVTYMRLPAALTERVPGFGGKRWLKLDLTKVHGFPGLSTLDNNPTMTDPRHLLQYLRAASASVTNNGSQVVDGVPTTHYHAMLNLDSLAANLPPAEQQAVQNALSQLRSSTNLHQLPMDVWVDGHHLVRRIAMSITLPAPDGAGLQEAMTADIGDYGPQPQPTAPPADQVQDLANLIHLQF
jgi:hypothetical protein